VLEIKDTEFYTKAIINLSKLVSVHLSLWIIMKPTINHSGS